MAILNLYVGNPLKVLDLELYASVILFTIYTFNQSKVSTLYNICEFSWHYKNYYKSMNKIEKR